MASLVGELLGVVPRLFDRTREQVDVATRLLARLPCMSALTGASQVSVTTTDGLDGNGSFTVPSDSGEAVLATVVPIQPHDSDQTPAPSAALLIPGYDELAASQVMPRLEALDVAELESIRSYESSHRGRRTILARIAQMQVE